MRTQQQPRSPWVVDVESWVYEGAQAFSDEILRSPVRRPPQAHTTRRPQGINPFAMSHIGFQLSRESRTVGMPRGDGGVV